MHHPTEFTTTERQLLHALSAGESNITIAHQLGKSEFTVRNQLSSLFKKINASNRTQAAGWYRDQLARQVPPIPPGGNGTYVPLRAPQNFDRMFNSKRREQ
jgi:DNA-binding CsgD family transcriptional regulator